MPTYNYPFSGGINAVAGYGDRWNFFFGGLWLSAGGENYTLLVTSTSGNLSLGVGVFNNQAPSVCMTFRDRVYIGLQTQFDFSDNGIPTAWEEQAPGAGFIDYLSQFGSQDTVNALGQMQGRLVVLARRSIQVWQPDADPGNFQLIQSLDNSGTQFPLAVQQLGDLDLIYPDDTGIRSLRVKETTLNAYVDDIGSPIDNILQPILPGLSTAQKTQVCGIVEPLTKNYWCHINGVIYVLSLHPSSKVSAWSKFEPRGNDNALFTPAKFVVFKGNVYCRSAQNGHYLYGSTSGRLYDAFSQVTFQLPWLDDKRPGTNKTQASVGFVMAGKWAISMATDPQSNTFQQVVQIGNAATPNVLTDSSYDIGRFPIDMVGTHFAMKAVSASTSTTIPVVFGSFVIYYNSAEIQ